MKEFTYTIRDELGIHARPAGMLVKKSKTYQSVLTLSNGQKTVQLNQLFMLMALSVKKGQTVTVRAEGNDEDIAIADMETFFEETL